jgi:hypothetical protein
VSGLKQGHLSKTAQRVLGVKAFSQLKAAKQSLPLSRSSYSQWGEDTWLMSHFGGRRGIYLDIGAGNPTNLSNTYLAYRCGWSGIAVDPCLPNVNLARFLRRRDLWIQGLVSSVREPVRFFELDPSFYSTTDPTVRDVRLEQGAYEVRITDMLPIRVSDLPFQALPDSIAYATIDVEGHELQVLESFDWARQLPPVIIVELWDDSAGLGSAADCREFLNSKGYRVEEVLGPDNHVFVHREASTLPG